MGRIDHWIFDTYPLRKSDLSVYRILYASYVLVQTLPVGLWLRDMPPAFFNPPISIAALFVNFPPFSFILALNVLFAICLCLLLLGWHTPYASIGTTLVWLFLNTWCYAPGKINHDILIVLTPLVFAFSGWGEKFSIDSKTLSSPNDDRVGSWSMSLLALVIGIAMFTAGWSKLNSGWLDPNRQSTYSHLVYNYYVTGRPTWAGEWFLPIHSAVLWKTFDFLTTFLEVGFLFTAFNRRIFVTFCILACSFHLCVWLLFDIIFSANVVVYGAAIAYSALPVPGWFRRSLKNLGPITNAVPAWAFLLVPLSLALTLVFVLENPQGPSVYLGEAVILTGCLIGMGYLSSEAVRKIIKTTETA